MPCRGSCSHADRSCSRRRCGDSCSPKQSIQAADTLGSVTESTWFIEYFKEFVRGSAGLGCWRPISIQQPLAVVPAAPGTSPPPLTLTAHAVAALQRRRPQYIRAASAQMAVPTSSHSIAAGDRRSTGSCANTQLLRCRAASGAAPPVCWDMELGGLCSGTQARLGGAPASARCRYSSRRSARQLRLYTCRLALWPRWRPSHWSVERGWGCLPCTSHQKAAEC